VVVVWQAIPASQGPPFRRARTAHSVHLECEMQSIDSATTAGSPMGVWCVREWCCVWFVTIEVQKSTGGVTHAQFHHIGRNADRRAHPRVGGMTPPVAPVEGTRNPPTEVNERLIIYFHGIGDPWDGVPEDERPYWCPRALWPAMADAIAGVAEQGKVRVEVTFDDGNSAMLRRLCPFSWSASSRRPSTSAPAGSASRAT
jgi:hypothetical protein